MLNTSIDFNFEATCYSETQVMEKWVAMRDNEDDPEVRSLMNTRRSTRISLPTVVIEDINLGNTFSHLIEPFYNDVTSIKMNVPMLMCEVYIRMFINDDITGKMEDGSISFSFLFSAVYNNKNMNTAIDCQLKALHVALWNRVKSM